jgi:hypothetical protein
MRSESYPQHYDIVIKPPAAMLATYDPPFTDSS